MARIDLETMTRQQLFAKRAQVAHALNCSVDKSNRWRLSGYLDAIDRELGDRDEFEEHLKAQVLSVIQHAAMRQ